MTDNKKVLRCPEHDVDLQNRPSADTVRAMICPAEPDSFMSTRNRWCGRCGARNASWMSGLCENCYRITSREQKQSQQESHDSYVSRNAIRTAIDEARDQNRSDITKWLIEYLDVIA